MQYECTTLRPDTPDLTDQLFERLTVLRFAGYRKNASKGTPFWTCQCTCGVIQDVPAGDLLRHHTRSCGCLARDVARQRMTTHGQSKTAEYRIWHKMRERCEDPKVISYQVYGARGITVCQAWHTFKTFYADMGPRPSPQHTIERLDNNAGYCPCNCRWILRPLQARNKRSNHLLTYNNTTQCIAAWAEETGLPASTIYCRKYRQWSDEKTLTTPVDEKKRHRHKP